MRIAVDARHLAGGRGVARYCESLLAVMAARHPDDDRRLVRGSRPAFASAALAGRPRLDRMAGGADVVWAPAPAPLAVSRDVPFVLTVHDLSWVERPADFTAYERLWHRLARIPRLVARADRIIAVSEATARDVRATWDVAASKVVLVRSGPGLLAAATDPPAPAGRPYFLMVGAIEPRKAPDVLARAYALARARGLDAGLVVAGSGRMAAPLREAGARIVERADDAALAALYAGAKAVVHPAFLEGFGYPPVEALARGVPAVVADLPVYDETIAGGALRVTPGDPQALADALLRLERDPGLAARLAAAGAAAVAALSWERAADETRAVLAEVAR